MKSPTRSIKGLSPTEIAKRLNANPKTLKSVLETIEPGKPAGKVIDDLNEQALPLAAKNVDPDKFGPLIKWANRDTLKAAFRLVPPKSFAPIIDKVDKDTLREAINQVPASQVAEVFEHVEVETLKAAVLSGADPKTAAEVLKRLSPATVKALLKELDVWKKITHAGPQENRMACTTVMAIIITAALIYCDMNPKDAAVIGAALATALCAQWFPVDEEEDRD